MNREKYLQSGQEDGSINHAQPSGEQKAHLCLVVRAIPETKITRRSGGYLLVYWVMDKGVVQRNSLLPFVLILYIITLPTSN